MSDPFVKLYATLLESSLWWGEDEHTRLVWITLLVAADHEGVYLGTLPGLAGKARVTLEQARHAIWRLQQPDEESRTPDNDGRRIELIEGVGFKLLNYKKYRDKRSPKQIADAAYKAAQRARAKPDMSGCQTQILDLRSEILDPRSGSAGSTGSKSDPALVLEGVRGNPVAAKPAPAKPKRRTKSTKVPLPDDLVPDASCLTLARKHGVDLAEEMPQFIDHHTKNGTRFADWQAAIRTWVRNAKRFGGASTARQSGNRVNSLIERARNMETKG